MNMTNRRHRIPWAKWGTGLGGVIVFTTILGTLATPHPLHASDKKAELQRVAAVAAPSQISRTKVWDPDGDGDDHRTTGSHDPVDQKRPQDSDASIDPS
jgi:uncharacterized membrane protein